MPSFKSFRMPKLRRRPPSWIDCEPRSIRLERRCGRVNPGEGLHLNDLHTGQRFTSHTHGVSEEQIKAFAREFLSHFISTQRRPREPCSRVWWRVAGIRAAITMRLLVERGLAGGIIGAGGPSPRDRGISRRSPARSWRLCHLVRAPRTPVRSEAKLFTLSLLASSCRAALDPCDRSGIPKA